MNLLPASQHGRPLILLAPRGVQLKQFARVVADRALHGEVLSEIQKLRGRVYLADRALTPSALTDDGRHLQSADSRSWHLVTLGEDATVQACGRILPHPKGVGFSGLMLSHSALAHSPTWGASVRRAVDAEIRSAAERRLSFAELGGWAIACGLRCTTEAIRMIVAGYALAQLIGGIAGVSTVTTLHHSSSILRRMGGRPLAWNGTELPAWHEPLYNDDEMELLRFDSSRPNPKYRSHIADCAAELREVVVICEDRAPRILDPVLKVQHALIPQSPGGVAIHDELA